MKKFARFSALLLTLLLLLPLCAGAAFTEELDVQSAIVVDAASGQVFFEKNSAEQRYPASTTKMVTALVLMEEVDNLYAYTVVSESSAADLGTDSSSVQPPLETGEQLSIGDLLKAILITSDNRACNVAAEFVCGGDIPAFVEKMNQKAAALGCTGTHFANPHGLHSEEHYTTAADLAKIAAAVLRHDDLMRLCETTQTTIPATNLQEERTLNSTNRLQLSSTPYYYSRARGIKTGFTTPAGYCLVSSAKKSDLEVICVVMGGSKDPDSGTITSFSDCRKLMSWALDAWEQRRLVAEGEIVAELPVALSAERDYVMVCTGAEITRLVPSDLEEEAVTRELVLTSPEGIDAPVKKGQELGVLKLSYQGEEIGQVPLVAATDVSFALRLLVERKLGEFFSNPIFWYVLAGLAVILVIYIRHVIKVNRERRRSRL